MSTFKPETKKLTCEYVVKVTSGNVKAAINTKGTLTLRGEGAFSLTVTVKYGDVVEKTIYINGEAEHVVGTEATCTNRAICGTCKASFGEYKLHDFTKQDASDRYLITPGDCETKAVYYLS